MKTAKLFSNGGSQAVRLPAEFKFDEVSEVYVRRDERTGDVILSTRGGAGWRGFMAMREQLGAVPQDFLNDRRQSTERRDPLLDWDEQPDAKG